MKDRINRRISAKPMQRGSGILLHISSLPTPYGIGTMGKSAYQFVNFLKQAGQQYWQILPLGTTGFSNSPYQNFSMHAGNPYFIDLDLLIGQNLLQAEAPHQFDFGTDPAKVDFALQYENKPKILHWAYEAFNYAKHPEQVEALNNFCEENTDWLEDYALFMTLKEHFSGHSWQDWPQEYKFREEVALSRFKEANQKQIEFYYFEQFIFFRQWQDLRHHANEQGIQIIGDMPIYVALDSVDVWVNPHLFQLDEDLSPTFVAGCPPDFFSKDGQLWGNPLYRWDEMAKDNYHWWVQRTAYNLKLYDYVRIDHFRGLEAYWAVPYGDTTAKRGLWIQGPREQLFAAIFEKLGDMPLIAEDLGTLTEEVHKLRDDLGLPGMAVLQFAFDLGMDSNYLPHNMKTNALAYSGTHDNDTIAGWLNSLDERYFGLVANYLGLHNPDDYVWDIVRRLMTTTPTVCILQMQDLLGLDNSARMNCPGTVEGNWQWRMLPDAITDEIAKHLHDLTYISGRLPEADH